MREPASQSKPAQTPVPAWFLAVLLVVMTVLAYQPAWHAGFIWDDDDHLTANPCIVGPLGFKGIWTTSAATYYPLVLTTFWVEHALWGLNPLPYHLVNIALHAGCALLLWGILRSLRVRGAWMGAAIWALHPVQAESVAWITELKNTQSCCFYLLAIVFFLRWRSAGVFAGRKGTEWDYGLVCVCAALAILSKSSTVMLPVVLGLLWWWMEGRWQWRNMIRLAPCFFISAAAGIWTIWEQQYHSKALGAEWAQSGLERLEVAGAAVWFYLGKLLWPHPLMFIYPRWKMEASDVWDYLPIIALALALVMLWFKRGGGMRPVFFCFAYYVVSLFPVMDFFKVYFFRYSFVGDHFQYLASLGPLALAGVGIAAVMERTRKPWLELMVCGALLATLGTLTWRQSRMYADDETLWQTNLRHNSESWLVHNNLGMDLSDKGQIDDAMNQFQEAILLQPNLADSHNNLGMVLGRKGQTDEAIGQFVEAIRLEPYHPEARKNLGVALAGKGQIDEAISQYREAIRLKPDFAEARNNLGVALEGKGQIDEAILQFREVIRLQPGNAQVHNNLGSVLAMKGQLDEAIGEFREAIRLKPDYAQAHHNLGTALSGAGQIDEAIRQFQEAIRLRPDFAAARESLDRALKMKGGDR